MKILNVKLFLFIICHILLGNLTSASTIATIPGDILYDNIKVYSGCRLHEFPLFDYADGENGYILFEVKPAVSDTFHFIANIGTGMEANRYCSLGPVGANNSYLPGVSEKIINAGLSNNWQANSSDYIWKYYLKSDTTYNFKVSYRKNGQKYGVNLYSVKVENSNSSIEKKLAFPGAEGFGRYTSGGRGGKVYHVTNLNDSGEGSLRQACQAGGARTVVFEVAGIIHLKSPLVINSNNITIAGQTAPGDGICIKNYPLQISANNVIIRYIRSRMGDEAKIEGDAASGRYCKDIIIDHCSFSWSVDECASFYSNENFTMQWCMINESMNVSVHSKVAHGYGGIWGGAPASFHHNLISSHQSRTPRFSGGNPLTELVDYRNNVIYNWGPSLGTYGGTGGNYNFIGNYYKPGPATSKKTSVCSRICYTGPSEDSIHYWGKFHLKDNYFDTSCTSLMNNARVECQQVNSNNLNGLHLSTTNYLPGGVKSGIISSSPFNIEPVTTHKASTAYTKVLALAGASLQRDTLDRRYVSEVKNGITTYAGSIGGLPGIIDTQGDVGGWPTYAFTDYQREKLKDGDRDGIPDLAEIELGLNEKIADGHLFTLDDVYTNLEIYINGLVNNITQQGLADGIINGITLPEKHNNNFFFDGSELIVPNAVFIRIFGLDGKLIKETTSHHITLNSGPGGVCIVEVRYKDLSVQKLKIAL